MPLSAYGQGVRPTRLVHEWIPDEVFELDRDSWHLGNNHLYDENLLDFRLPRPGVLRYIGFHVKWSDRGDSFSESVGLTSSGDTITGANARTAGLIDDSMVSLGDMLPAVTTDVGGEVAGESAVLSDELDFYLPVDIRFRGTASQLTDDHEYIVLNPDEGDFVRMYLWVEM